MLREPNVPQPAVLAALCMRQTVLAQNVDGQPVGCVCSSEMRQQPGRLIKYLRYLTERTSARHPIAGCTARVRCTDPARRLLKTEIHAHCDQHGIAQVGARPLTWHVVGQASGV